MNNQKINRRSVLKLAAFGAFGAFGAAMPNQTTAAEKENEIMPDTNERRPRPPFVQTADGTHLYYKDWGSGQMILFVHSWGVNSDLWQYQMNDLAESGFRCAAYDRRGHGRSGQPWDGYDYDTLAADLNSVIETIKLDKITLVSHSMAIGEIVRYVTKYGVKRISKIIFTAPALNVADDPNGTDRAASEQFRAFLKKDVQAALRAGVSGFFGGNPPVSKDLIEWGLGLFQQTSLRALLECNRSNTETNFRRELKNIRIPTLIIHGGADVSAPLELTAKPCAALMTNAKLKIYKDAPHGIILTHKDKITRDISAFVRN